MKSLFLLVLFITNSAFAEIKEVTVTGYGATFSAAKKDAVRAAVEQVMGVKMKSNTLVKEGMLEEDKVASTTDGLINSFEVVSKEADEDGDFEVKLKVKIDTESTGAKNIDAFIKDKKSMRMFTKENFNNRSVMVLYSTRGIKKALSDDSEAVQALLDDLQDQLLEKSFDVKLKNSLEGMAQDAGGSFDDKDAVKMAKLANSDAVVLATITTSDRIKDDGYTMVKANVMTKAYDTSSGRLFANVAKKSSTLISTDGGELFEGRTKAAKKAAKKVSKTLIKKIVERMSTGANKFIILTFQAIDIDTQDSILDVMDDKGFEYKIEKQAGETMKLKLTSDESASSFRRSFRKVLRKAEIKLKPISTQGSEIVYTKR
ncbi:MAG: LPP20 family lipoprotein [Gammaproteobacteria bacterium]|nr:LPP20 family lipoprotein [Gammaproteobacteria bacterium]